MTLEASLGLPCMPAPRETADLRNSSNRTAAKPAQRPDYRPIDDDELEPCVGSAIFASLDTHFFEIFRGVE